MGVGYTVGPMLKSTIAPWPRDWPSAVTVKVCNHAAWESVLLMPGPERPVGDEVVRCERCHAPRCGDARDEDPCMRVQGHTIHHLSFNRQISPVDGTRCSLAGCDCVEVAQRVRLHQRP